VFQRPGRILVAGGANLDVKARTHRTPRTGTSNPGSVVVAPGGVGRNIAHALALLGEEVTLVTAVGRDAAGDGLLASCESAGIDCSLVERAAAPTGVYVATLEPDGELFVGVSGMEVMAALTPARIAALEQDIAQSSVVLADANLAPETLVALGLAAARHGVPLAVEPVSVPKAARLVTLLDAGVPVALMTPNGDELPVVSGVTVHNADDIRRATSRLHMRGVQRLLIGLGREGVLVSTPEETRLVSASTGLLEDVTGGGDAAFAAAIWALRRGSGLAAAAQAGQTAAREAVATTETVPQSLAAALAGAGRAPGSAFNPPRRSDP
jgi:pseudouridine kinase